MYPVRQRGHVTGAEVSYLEWPSAPGAPPVLLLHGAGVDTASLSWRPLGGELARAGYRVIAPDHPGYGESPPPSWRPSQERLLRYVGEFVEALSLEDYVVGGLSLGGGLTLGHLLQRNGTNPGTGNGGQIRAGMIFGSYGLMRRQLPGLSGLVAHALLVGLDHLGISSAISQAGLHPRFLPLTMDGLITNPVQRTPELLTEIREAGEQTPGLASFTDFRRLDLTWKGFRTDYTARLPDLDVPILLVHGSRDRAVPMVYARRAAARLPDSTLLEVSGAAHWVQRDRPDLVTPAVVDFLGSVHPVNPAPDSQPPPR